MTDQHSRYQPYNVCITNDATQRNLQCDRNQMWSSYLIPQSYMPHSAQAQWPIQNYNNVAVPVQSYVQSPIDHIPVAPVKKKKSGPLVVLQPDGAVVDLESSDKPVAEVKPQQSTEQNKPRLCLVDFGDSEDAKGAKGHIDGSIHKVHSVHEYAEKKHVANSDVPTLLTAHVNGNKVNFVSPSIVVPPNNAISTPDEDIENYIAETGESDLDYGDEMSDSDSIDDYVDEEICSRKHYSKEKMLELKTKDICRFKPELFPINPHTNHRNHRGGHREIVLKHVEPIKGVQNAFKPSHLAGNKKDLSRSLHAVLNRLTEKNISETASKILEMQIKTTSELNLVAQNLLKMATGQKKYCHLFAQLAIKIKDMRSTDNKVSDKKDNTLKSLLLSLTCDLFNKNFKDIKIEINKEIDAWIADTEDEQVKNLFENDRESTIAKRRDAFMCNMLFVGELYIHGMIPESIITRSTKKMISHFSEDGLESVVTLLNVCGEKLDKSDKKYLTQLLVDIDQQLKNAKVSSYLCYRYRELKELRSHDWKEDPKTTPTPTAVAVGSSGGVAKRYSQMDDRSLPRRSMNDVTKRPLQNKHCAAAHLTLNTADLSKVRLGTSTNWASGSGGAGGGQATQSKCAWNLPLPMTDNGSKSGVSTNDGGSPHFLLPITQIDKAVLHSVEARVIDLDSELNIRLLSDNSLKKAVGSESSSAALFVYVMLKRYYAKSPKLRSAGESIAKLFSLNCLNLPALQSGVKKFMEMSVEEEFEEDCPTIWSNLGQLMAPVVLNGVTNPSILQLTWLRELALELKNKAGGHASVNFVASCMGYAGTDLDADKDQLTKRFTTGCLGWSLFLDSGDHLLEVENLTKLLTKNKAEYLINCIDVANPRPPTNSSRESTSHNIPPQNGRKTTQFGYDMRNSGKNPTSTVNNRSMFGANSSESGGSPGEGWQSAGSKSSGGRQSGYGGSQAHFTGNNRQQKGGPGGAGRGNYGQSTRGGSGRKPSIHRNDRN